MGGATDLGSVIPPTPGAASPHMSTAFDRTSLEVALPEPWRRAWVSAADSHIRHVARW